MNESKDGHINQWMDKVRNLRSNVSTNQSKSESMHESRNTWTKNQLIKWKKQKIDERKTDRIMHEIDKFIQSAKF